MKTIASLRDLEQHGIIALTGEADNLGFRYLCDLTQKGRRIVNETLGLNRSTEESFAGNYNHGDPKDPHVASMMISGDGYGWIPFGIIALISECGCHTVLVTEKAVLIGLEMGELYIPPQFAVVAQAITQTEPAAIKTPDWHLPVPWPSNCYGDVKRVIRGDASHPHSGTRNIHTAAGRVI